MLGSLKNSIMPHVLPFFRLQWAFLCSRNRSRPNFDERKGPKHPRLDKFAAVLVRESDTKFRLPIHFRQMIFENRSGNVDGRENVGDQTYDQGDRKSADGSGA